MSGNVSRPGATVTSRALALVGAFDDEHRRLTLSQLAERAGLPVPTAHRLVGELVAWGALSRTASGEYVVGRRLWAVGLLAPAAVQDEVLAHLTRVTAYTINQPGTLRRQLARVLVEDHATTVEEMSLGACSIGVPIRVGAAVVAALGIVVPSLKTDGPKLVTAMQVAARGIGRRLTEAARTPDTGR